LILLIVIGAVYAFTGYAGFDEEPFLGEMIKNICGIKVYQYVGKGG
jgi:hypothetical protein